jgi:putative copper resistance protein D
LSDPLVYVRAVHFAATIVAAGTVIFQCLIAAPALATASRDLSPARERLRSRWAWMVWVSLAVAVLSGAIWLVLLAADIYGAAVDEVWRNGDVWTVAMQTRFGQVSMARLALAVLLAGWLAMLAGTIARDRWGAFPVILAIGFLIGPAWTGHAGAMPGGAGQISLAADALHLLAAGVWLGSLPPLVMLLAAAWRNEEPARTAVVATAVRRFSLLGIASVGVLLASGIINTWYEVGSLRDLIATAYGRLVLAKIALFAAMVSIAAANRFHLTPRLAAAGAVRRLQHSSLAETALGTAAILVVGFLGTMAPASHAHLHPAYATVPAGAAFVHIHSVAGMADVTITPGRVGGAHATIRLWNQEFEPLAAEKVTLALTAPAAGSKPVIRAASQDEDGNWQIDGIELSQPGNWIAAVDAGLDAKRRLLLEAPIVIEPEQ